MGKMRGKLRIIFFEHHLSCFMTWIQQLFIHVTDAGDRLLNLNVRKHKSRTEIAFQYKSHKDPG